MNNDINISPEEFDVIERYVLNEMPPEERVAFANRLSNDTALQDRLSAVQLLLLGVQEASLTEKMNDFHKSLPASVSTPIQSIKKSFPLNRWLIAASVIAILGLAAWFFSKGFKKEERIFTEYYKPDPGLISAMGISDNYTFDRAMIEYKLGNYDTAIQTWERLLKNKPGNDTLNYFLGSAYLANQKTEKAIVYFEKVLAVTNSYFLKDAYWYTGLALIKESKIKEAIAFIEKADNKNKEAILLRVKE